MLRSVVLKSLRDGRGSALPGGASGSSATSRCMVSVFPTVQDNPSLNKLVEDYPEALKAFIAFGGAGRLHLRRGLSLAASSSLSWCRCS